MSDVNHPEFDVIVAGAGPTGLMLACELALAGVRTVVLERLAARPGFCRGFNLNARSLELLDRRGLAERFLANGMTRPFTGFGGLDTPLSLADAATDHPYTLGIPQTRTEELLEECALELGVTIRWASEVVDLAQDDQGITVDVRDPHGLSTLRSSFLAGCDGGRSTVRRRAGIAFPGTDATRYALLGDVVLTDPSSLPFGTTRTPNGAVFVIPRPGYVRLITAERERPADKDQPVTLDELRATVRHVVGREIGLTDPRWLTRFGDAARQAESYRAGRILLAGDAAHIHPPAGAQGLNVGLHDAFNLGWKLAAELHGWAPPGLLDSYHTERHAAVARVLLNTRAQVALADPDERFHALRTLFAELAGFDAVRTHLAEMVTGLGTRYSMGVEDPHPLVGRLAPNLTLRTPAGETTLARSLHTGRGVLIDLGNHPELREIGAGWSDRVDTVIARCAESIGSDSLLVRPDGTVAWALPTGDRPSTRDLEHALYAWFGKSRPPGGFLSQAG